MKFIHIADVHLGAIPDSNMPWAKDRQNEIWESFKNIIDVCNLEKADLLLIAGDLFHRQPLIRELKEVNYLFTTLEAARVVLVAGNHDYIGARSNYSSFKWDERVHMFLKDSLEVVDFPDINTSVYGFSYLTRDITEPKYDDMELPYVDDSRINILLAHGGDEKNIPINRKRLLGHEFDYIALGHIHKPEIISNRMAYSGSLEPLDKNETGQRGYIIGEINEDGRKSTDIRFVSSSLREYKSISITVDQNMTMGELADEIKRELIKQGPRNIYQIVIKGFRDENIHFDKEAIYSLGHIIDVTDESHPDYDFDALYRENSDNMIGMFIKRIKDADNSLQGSFNGTGNLSEINKKALYYGIEALLGARR
jgi:DNA repair exonuclease SbcCD nuclease subunit